MEFKSITRNWSIQRKILLPSIGGISIIGFSLFTYFIYTIYTLQNATISTMAKRTTEILVNSLEYPVLSGNTTELEGLIDWLMEQPEIQSISVYTLDSLLLARSKNETVSARYLNSYIEPIVIRAAVDTLNTGDEYYSSATAAEKTIGRLEIVISDKQAEDLFIKEAVVALAIFAPFTVAVLSLGLISVSSTNAGFKSIIDGMIAYKRGNYSTRIESPDNNDIGKIAEQFNAMAETIEEKEKKLQDAHNLQNKFMSTMSHDLRTPLGIISSSIEIILDNEKSIAGSSKLLLLNTKSATHQLEKLIDDIITINRVEKKVESLSLKRCDLIALLANIVQTIEFEVKKKDLAITLVNTGLKSLWVEIDEAKFIRIINNIIGNSVKFTPRGSINVICETIETGNGTIDANITIQDTGIGISENDLKTIFEPFGRVDSVENQTISGSGLGLSIVREFVDMMNGKINVNSSPRLGTAVSITIPLTVIQHIRSEQTRPLNVIGFHSKDDTITVLFVDDRSEYRDIVGNYLRDFNVIICATGQEAIDAYKEHRPDIVFLDCFMPIMDGYTVSTKIREYEKETHLKATPIVALTANAVPESEQKTKHSGMNDIMYKPFSKHQLIEKIKVWLRTEAIDRRNQQ